MRALLIAVVCLLALAGGVGLAVVCMRYPLEIAHFWNAGSTVFSTATTTPSSDSSTASNGQWKPPKEFPAQDNWTWHTKDGKTYENVVINQITTTDVSITHSLGVAHVSLDALPPEVQNAIQYDPAFDATAKAASLTPIATMLNNKLVDIRGQPAATPDASIKYYAIYYSAESDSNCRAFTPTLVAWYGKFKPDHKDFMLVLVSQEKSEGAMYSDMDAMQMPWPAVKFSELQPVNAGTFRGPGIQQFANTGIPDLVLVDSSGKVIADSFSGNVDNGPQSVVDYMNQNLGMN